MTDPSLPVGNVTIENLYSRVVKLRWEPPNCMLLRNVVVYTIIVVDNDNLSSRKNLSSSLPFITVSGLIPFTNYLGFICLADEENTCNNQTASARSIEFRTKKEGKVLFEF